MKYTSAAILLFVLTMFGSSATRAQEQTQKVQSGGGATTVVGTTTGSVSAKVTAEIIASSSTATVKGAPFSAEAVSESVQILSDGNRITRSYTTKMFRDSDGRFRREGGGGNGLPVAGGGSGYGYVVSGAGGVLASTYAQNAVSIFDPVANIRYIFNTQDKTARKIPAIPGMAEGAVIVNGQPLSASTRTLIESNAAQKSQVVVVPGGIATTVSTGVGSGSSSNMSKTESLGTREVEGVMAEGSRTVTTIPAGAIGNERPIEMVYERWYSKELQLTVYSKHTDPRFGEQTYRLTNINRSEPDRSLFVPPGDYKIVTEPTVRGTYNIVTTTTPAKQQ